MLGLSRPVLLVLIAAAVMLSFSMGVRQSLGLLMPPLTRDVGITVADFTFAIAMQNLIFGFAQPLAGAAAVRHGFRTVMTVGALTYAAGLLTLAMAQGTLSVALGAGALIGIGLACTATAVTLSAGARIVSPAQRSMILGVLTAAGSIGPLLSAPLLQWTINDFGWRMGGMALFAFGMLMLPAAWIAGRADRLAPAGGPKVKGESRAHDALRLAFREPSFVVMSCAYFVCGMQLVFLTTHLPSYLAICGMDPMLGAQALGVIGGFNVLGSLFFGWAGGRFNKLALLGIIYVLRSIVLGWYFLVPPTPATTLLFAALMGFLWLGVAPLVAGAIVDMFGLKWQAMLQGVAFMGHQVGSFMGAFGGGLLFDSAGNYDLAWRLGVGIGIAAGLIQIACALVRSSESLSEVRRAQAV
jgi:MFS family permease